MAKTYRIHPALGIARLGSSSEFFIGPEVPEVAFSGPYRDAQGALKRQAASFRIFEFDSAIPNDAGTEITSDAAKVKSISWTVELANKKASWFNFAGRTGEISPYPPNAIRNLSVQNRRSLNILPGPRSVSAPGDTKEFRRGTSPAGFQEQFPAVFSDGRSIDTL